MIVAILSGLAVVIIGYIVRLSTFWAFRHRGCDAYYFMLSSEVYRKKRSLPITLPPVYLLEQQEQWYPPGFSIFLSWIPEKWLKKHYWAISPAIDCMTVGMTYIFIFVLTGNVWWASIAGLIHAVSSASIVDCTNLNSRPLGAMLFTVTMLGVVGASLGGPLVGFNLILVMAGGVMLLFTHKLSSQLLYVLLPMMAVALRDPQFVVLLALIILLSFIPGRGMIVSIWQGHADILRFWGKHWGNLGAHQINDSPIYKDEGPEEHETYLGGKMFLGGIGGLFKQIQYMAMNPAIMMIVFPIWFYSGMEYIDKLLFWWVAITYIFAGSTVFVKKLRFIGEGHRYLKLASLPVGYMAILPLIRGWEVPMVYWVMLGVSLIIALIAIIRMRRFMGDPTKTLVPFVDQDLQKVIDYLKGEETQNILCVPNSLADAIGYYCMKGVIRGTHNYPIGKVEPFFPVHQLPLDYLIKGYEASHVVVSRSYVSPNRLYISEDMKVVLDVGNYLIYAKEDQDATKGLVG